MTNKTWKKLREESKDDPIGAATRAKAKFAIAGAGFNREKYEFAASAYQLAEDLHGNAEAFAEFAEESFWEVLISTES